MWLCRASGPLLGSHSVGGGCLQLRPPFPFSVVLGLVSWTRPRASGRFVLGGKHGLLPLSPPASLLRTAELLVASGEREGLLEARGDPPVLTTLMAKLFPVSLVCLACFPGRCPRCRFLSVSTCEWLGSPGPSDFVLTLGTSLIKRSAEREVQHSQKAVRNLMYLSRCFRNSSQLNGASRLCPPSGGACLKGAQPCKWACGGYGSQHRPSKGDVTVLR